MSILKIEKLNTYYGKSHILQGVNFDLNKIGCLALLGRNGAGKTTTLRSIVNLTRPISGKVLFNKIDLKGLSTYQIADKGLTMVPENRGMFSSLSVLESLNIIKSNKKEWDIDRVLESFPQFDQYIRGPPHPSDRMIPEINRDNLRRQYRQPFYRRRSRHTLLFVVHQAGT